MDVTSLFSRIRSFLVKYKYPVVVLVIGLTLMWLPAFHNQETQTQIPESTPATKEVDLTQQLSEILSQIDGVGRVKVMLKVSEGESTIYQTDEDISSSSVRKDTVILTDSNRNDQPLVVQTIPAVYRGAIIVCQGGDKASVKIAVMEAVSKVTGLDVANISVLKMK